MAVMLEIQIKEIIMEITMETEIKEIKMVTMTVISIKVTIMDH